MKNRDSSLMLKKINNAIRVLQSAANTAAATTDSTLQNNIREGLEKLRLAQNEIKSNPASANEIIEEIRHYINDQLSDTQQSEQTRSLLLRIDTELDIQFTHAMFEQPKDRLNISELKWENINRICFRGDSRDPIADGVFENGFIPPETGDKAINQPFDSQRNVIAFSSRFTAAACFPMNPDVETTWVYLIKPENAFNVHAHGYTSQTSTGVDIDSAEQMFVQELITDKIPPERIIGAIQIVRSPGKTIVENDFLDFYLHRGTYKMTRLKINNACDLPDDEVKLALLFLKNEIKANREGSDQLPPPSSGFVRNTTIKVNSQDTKKRLENYIEQQLQQCRSNTSAISRLFSSPPIAKLQAAKALLAVLTADSASNASNALSELKPHIALLNSDPTLHSIYSEIEKDLPKPTPPQPPASTR